MVESEYKIGGAFWDTSSGERHRFFGQVIATSDASLHEVLLAKRTAIAIQELFEASGQPVARWLQDLPALSTALAPELEDMGVNGVRVATLKCNPPVATQPASSSAPAAASLAAPVAATAFAVGAQVLVAWSDGNRYPASVVQVSQGQYLVAFPNGQQQWVAGKWLGYR
jgi:hypothetical protein